MSGAGALIAEAFVLHWINNIVLTNHQISPKILLESPLDPFGPEECVKLRKLIKNLMLGPQECVTMYQATDENIPEWGLFTTKIVREL